jgi:SAM-dependent methyltransferase
MIEAHTVGYIVEIILRGVSQTLLCGIYHPNERMRCAGTGILSLELARRGLGVTALDLFRTQLDRLEAKAVDEDVDHLVTPVVADMNEGLPFSDDAFSTVVSLRATRYVEDFDRWVNEVHRVLEPGGSFVLPVFAIDTIPWKRNSDKGIHLPTGYRHLKSAIIEAGFEINTATATAPRYLQAVDLSLGRRDVPFYYRPKIIVAKAQK